MRKILLFLDLLLLAEYGLGAKVLIYNPHFAHSHFNFLAKLADILQESGHNVVSSIIF